MNSNIYKSRLNLLVMISTIAFSFIMLCTSCTKVVDINVSNDTGKLVIEGNVVDTLGTQYIKLSKNVPFSNSNNYPALSGAVVTVSDGIMDHKYEESQPGIYTSPAYQTEAGKNYTMHVSVNGSDYTAVSTMPTLVRLDSLTSKISVYDHKKRDVTIHYKDPAGSANQYRFVMFLNGVQVKAIFVANDQFNDGKNVSIDLHDDDTDVFAGDKVTIEMQSIDYTSYTYWNTLMQQLDSGPGGSVTPSNPPNNISPIALGYFSAHTSEKRIIVVK